MHYQQPPAPGGYPPPGASQPIQQPQQQAQQYYEQPRSFPAPGPQAPPAGVVLMGGLAMLLLGVILRGVVGFMDPGDSSKNVYAVGCLVMAIGLLLGAHAMFTTGLKDKEAPTAVRATTTIVAVILVILSIGVSAQIGRLF